MCDKCCLTDLVHRALDAADAASGAMVRAEELDALTAGQQRRVAALRKEIAQGTFFSEVDMDDFRALSHDLETAIRSGTVTHYVADEHAVSGGYEETIRGEASTALVAMRSALLTLADRVGDVRHRVRAETIAQELRGM